MKRISSETNTPQKPIRHLWIAGVFLFYYLFPGSDHSEQKNWRNEKGANHRAKMNPKPDIWSRGSNNEDDINQWNDPNDPFSETEDSENDDITNWFQNER